MFISIKVSSNDPISQFIGWLWKIQVCIDIGSYNVRWLWRWLLYYTVSPRYSRGYVSYPPANPKNPRIMYAVLKRLCMILYTLKYASKTHSKDSLTH